MKKTILFSILALCAPFSGAIPAPEDVCAARTDGERKAIARGLYGRIQFVDVPSLADYIVCPVDYASGVDLRVQIVNAGANSPGMWEIVDVAPDFRVYVTDIAGIADILIHYVSAGPGPGR